MNTVQIHFDKTDSPDNHEKTEWTVTPFGLLEIWSKYITRMNSNTCKYLDDQKKSTKLTVFLLHKIKNSSVQV